MSDFGDATRERVKAYISAVRCEFEVWRKAGMDADAEAIHADACLIESLLADRDRLAGRVAELESVRDKAVGHVDRWREAAEVEHAARLEAEAQRDAYHAALRLYVACKDDVPWSEVTSVESWVKSAVCLKVEPCPPPAP